MVTRLLLAATLIILVGCDNDLPSTKDVSTKTHDLEGQHLTLLVPWTHLGAAESLAKWFYEETGGIVKIAKVEYHDLLQESLNDYDNAESQLDVLLLWYCHIGRLVEEGILTNLEEFYKDYEEELVSSDFIDHFFESHAVYNGEKWAIPFDGDVHVLFYRKSILEKYNLDPPTTWEEFTHHSKRITEGEAVAGIYGSAIMAHPNPVLIISSFMNRLGQVGAEKLSSQTSPKVNSREAVAALERMVEQSRYALPTPLETDFAVSRDAFLQGKVAMIEQWTDLGIMADDIQQSLVLGDWGVVPIPKISTNQEKYTSNLNAGWSLGLSTKAPNRDIAERFLVFATRPDITLRLNLIPGGGGIDPIRKSVIQSTEFQQFAPKVSKVERELMESEAVVWSKSPKVPELFGALAGSITAALEGRKTSEQALDDCQRSWLSILAEEKE